MKRNIFRKWAAAGVLLASFGALQACDRIEERKKNFGELSQKVKDQVAHDVLGEATQEDLLAQAPVDARAISGVMVAAVPLQDVTLEEMLRTESYFAVGSVIAKPKVEVSRLVAPQAVAAPAPVASRSVMSAPKGLQRERLAPAISGDAADTSDDANVAVEALKDRASALSESVESAADGGVDGGVFEKKLELAPRLPRMRKELDMPKAQTARMRATSKLEELGLSGSVMAGEGGQMVIQIGIDPTAFPLGGPATRLERMDRRFAPRDPLKRLNCRAADIRRKMKSDAEMATRCVVEALAESGEYEYVEKDYIFTHQFERRTRDLPVAPVTDTRIDPNDPLWALQWDMQNQGEGEGETPGGAGFEDFWTRTRQVGSAGVTVAVVDTGLQMNHPDINGSTNLAPGFDMVSDPFMANDGDGRDANPNDPGDACDPSDPLSQDTFHGTHVAGTVGVAATNNANGVAGGAWNVTIVPVRALGRCGGQLSDINDGIRWAAGVVPARDDLGAEIWNANPADIINLSIGLFERCPASMQEAINDATEAGSIVVAAAGNARIDTKYYAPGGCQNVVTVGASDLRGMLTPYSNYGDAVDILAPGGDMARDDNNDGRPDGILSTKTSKDCYDPVTGDTVEACYYAFESGTSMAAPHVSAAFALLKSQFPTENPDQLVARLKAATSPRDQLQCSGKCTHYPGSAPIPGADGMCYRPCGGSILNLAKASLE